MKLAIKLRTRLFLSISALITVALLGLLLGLMLVFMQPDSCHLRWNDMPERGRLRQKA